ncbi:MAG: ATP-binding protein [Synechococcales bacterium]|nr:ATP-binding protein [Synechococcales bacterium]
MNLNSDWQTLNQDILQQSLAHIQQLLQQFCDRLQGKKFGIFNSPAPSWKPPQTAETSALQSLCDIFQLSHFERDLLLLCAGVELSGAIAQLCGTAQGNSNLTYATFSLALAVFPEAHWTAITPAHPLRHWRLIEIVSPESLTQSRLRIDERILHFLNGVNYLDDRLRGFMTPIAPKMPLPPSHIALVKQIIELWQQETPPIIQLCGTGQDAKETIAAITCQELGFNLHRLSASDIPSNLQERESLARLWEREAILGRSALLVEIDDRDPVPQAMAWLHRVQSLVILALREPILLQHRAQVRLDVAKPTTVEQQQIWHWALGEKAIDLNGQLEILTSQFDLSAESIQSSCLIAGIKQEKLASIHQSVDTFDLLWQSCRDQARTRLDDLAQRITAKASWNELVLPESQMQMLWEIVAQVRQRSQVYDKWEFAVRGANGLGISALFAGASGTGKTMAAEVLANELNLDLYRIDLSQVVSKYIGETEKNLRLVFEAAESSGAILLFDEADALFGKRSEVKDSHDRYANIEVSYLLQRMEAYRGLAVLTSNLRSSIDPAFLRRLRFVVQFPFPDAQQRQEIWQRIFPTKLPTEDLDFTKLAQLHVTGGNIRNIALNAAFLAADHGSALKMEHLLRSAQTEYIKLEQTLTEAETTGWISKTSNGATIAGWIDQWGNPL